MGCKLSCPDFAFPLLGYEGVLDLIAAMGFHAVDVGLLQDRSHLQPSDQYGNAEASAKTLKSRLEARALIASDVFLQGGLDFFENAINHPGASKRARMRELFQKTLEYAAALGCGHVTGLPGAAFPGEESYDASYERCVGENRWRAQKAKEYGLAYGVEAHIDSIIEKPAQALGFVKEAGGTGLTLDYSHFVRLGYQDTDGDVLLPYANHFHARGASRGVLQTTVADNEIDFDRIFEKLSEQGYGGYICLEYCWTPNWENCARNDNISEIILLKRWAESCEK